MLKFSNNCDSVALSNIFIDSYQSFSFHRAHIQQAMSMVRDIVPTLPKEAGRYMGLEVEMEQIKFAPGVETVFEEELYDPCIPASLFFRTVEDHSLRENGLEFVSKTGLTKDQIIFGLQHLFTTDVFKVPPKNSIRTSVHVHVNIMDMTMGQFKSMLLFYLFLEPYMFKISGQRYRNIFCQPVVNSSMPIYALLASTGNHSFLASLGVWTKYSALNLACARTMGTVEFRHHCGASSSKEISNWMCFIDLLFEVAKDYTNPEQLLKTILLHIHNETFDNFMSTTFNIPFEGYDEHTKTVLSELVDRSQINYDELSDSTRTKKKSLSYSITNTSEPVYATF